MINDKLSAEKIILAIVILAVLGLAVYFVIPKNPSPVAVQPTASPTIMPQPTVVRPTLTPVPRVDVSSWDTYRNTEIGIEFKYPSILGAPEILQTDNTNKKPENVFAGKKIDAYFKDANNKYSWLSFAAYTSDYQGFKDFFIFRGSKDISNECLKPLTYNNKGEACKIIEVADNKAIWKNYFVEDECSPAFGSQIYFNNKSQSAYKGLSFVFHFKDAETKVTDLYSCVDTKATEQAYLEAVIQSKNIMERKNLSTGDLQQINLIDQILSTFKFIK